MLYNGTIYRPTAEASTFLLPVTEGCTHNKCTFCNMFKDVPFRMLQPDEIEKYLIEEVAEYHRRGREIDRIFLVGADPFAITADKLQVIADMIHRHVLECRTITMYAAVRNIMIKSNEDLKRIADMGINEIYIGIESTLDDVLIYFNKGHSVKNAIIQLKRLNAAGIKHRDMIIPGSAGKDRGEESGRAFANFFSEVKPDMILFTAMSFFPGTGLYDDVQSGKFIPAREKEVLTEEKVMLENVDSPQTYLWAAHALNSVHLIGLVKERGKELIHELNLAIDNLDESEFEKRFVRAYL